MSFLLLFNRVYRLEIQSVMLVFRLALWTIAPLVSSTPPPPFHVWISIQYLYNTRIQCVRGKNGVIGWWGWGPQTDKTPATKSLYRSIFFSERHLALLSISLIFLRWEPFILIHCLFFVKCSEKKFLFHSLESTSDYVNGAQIKLFDVIFSFWYKLKVCTVTRMVKQTNCSVVPMYGYYTFSQCFITDHCLFVLDYTYNVLLFKFSFVLVKNALLFF